ncbi:MAG: peptidoglycan editing factor PgeF [Armatimonadota bacterium]
MIENLTDTIKLMEFENLSAHNTIKHFVTTRTDGFSAPPYHSLNIGYHVADDPAKVTRNRTRLAVEIGMPLTSFTFAKQVHGNKVTIVTRQMKGKGATNWESAIDDTDALVTSEEDICLMVLVADCVPVLFFDPIKRVVGAAHAGWKGTALKIASAVVDTMISEFKSNPTDIIAGIGPSIGPCCYQVSDEIISEIDQSQGTGFVIDGYLNLWEANRSQLVSSGIPDKNIEVAQICTCCNSDTFFSYRHERPTGRFGAGILLRNEICASCTAMHCNWCNK